MINDCLFEVRKTLVVMDDNKLLQKLSQNLLEILDDNEYYDITVEVGDDPHVKIFRAHMVILNYRSPYLRRILSTNEKKDDSILTHIKLSNILPETFQIILRYIYGGKLSLEEYNTSDIVNILVSASELSLQELTTHLQSFLIENKKDWIEQNFNLIYQTSFNNDSFLKLQNFCTELISKEPEKVFNSIDFTSLSKKCLISLIQNDNIQMDNIQIWEHVLKWGIAQNPELSSDPSSYSKDDFNVLKDTLQQFIPFVKFYNLNSKEFIDKVYPYKKIIPKELREKLIKNFIYQQNNNSELMITKEINSKSIDSKIITIQHVELISRWIDKLEITDNIKNLYEFKLILRGSRDGFSPKKFHEICNNKSDTITIIKVRDSNEILGGYNPIIWKPTSGHSNTINSFIFSFNNKDNIENFILSRVEDDKNAIYNNPNYGPSFGNCDLVLYGNNFYDQSYCKKSTCYEKLIRETEYFSVEEYEMFQIVKGCLKKDNNDANEVSSHDNNNKEQNIKRISEKSVLSREAGIQEELKVREELKRQEELKKQEELRWQKVLRREELERQEQERQERERLKELERQKRKERRELEKQEELRLQKEFERRKELDRQEQLKMQKELKRQEELERQEQFKWQKELKMREELEIQEQLKLQKELKMREELEIQEQLKWQKELKMREEFEIQEQLKWQKELKMREEFEIQEQLKWQKELKMREELEIQEQLKWQKELKRQEELERQEQLKWQIVLKRQEELERQEQLKWQKELKRQEELERQEQLKWQIELKRQEELERQEQLKWQKELKMREELERQEQLKWQEELKRQQ